MFVDCSFSITLQLGGQLVWEENELKTLKELLIDVLEISEANIKKINTADDLKKLVFDKVIKINEENIEKICYVITMSEGD